jgi:hypothetical protein
MDENILSLSPEQLFERLHGALAEGDLQRAGVLAKAVDQHWAFAVAEKDRAKLHLLSRKLLEAAAAAAVVIEECPPMAAWNQRWLTLSEMAELILAVDTESAAMEDRKALQSFTHADKVLRFLNEERIGTLAEIQEAIGGAVTRQTTWNHVHRLVKSGMLTRVNEGVYRLTSRGQAVARLLAEEKRDGTGAKPFPPRQSLDSEGQRPFRPRRAMAGAGKGQ